jgi:hypothetical protein
MSREEDKPDEADGPDEEACRSAILARDRNYDGAFVYAVRSTGICFRPSCPAPPMMAGRDTSPTPLSLAKTLALLG